MKASEIHGDTIQSLIRERKDTEKEIRDIQREIERRRIEKQLIDGEGNAGSGAEESEERNRLIEELSLMKKAKAQKLKEICRVVRTISSGD